MKTRYKKNLLEITLFFILVNLPYLTITTGVGADVFFDTFERPQTYQYIKCSPKISTFPNQQYILIQKPRENDYGIKPGDHICYINEDGYLAAEQVQLITTKTPTPKYYLQSTSTQDHFSIHQHQIIGKVITSLDDNIWNTLSLNIWESSRQNLNAVAFLLT